VEAFYAGESGDHYLPVAADLARGAPDELYELPEDIYEGAE
jgi:hypothetical protein